MIEAATIGGFRLNRAVSALIRFLELPTSFEALLASWQESALAVPSRPEEDRGAIPDRFFVWRDPVELDRAVDRLVDYTMLGGKQLVSATASHRRVCKFSSLGNTGLSGT